jgi:hypothetical protein
MSTCAVGVVTDRLLIYLYKVLVANCPKKGDKNMGQQNLHVSTAMNLRNYAV